MPHEQDDQPRKDNGDSGDARSGLAKYARYSQVAWTFIGSFGVPTAIGVWIDTEAGSSPWGTVIGLFAGLSVATWLTMREMARKP